MTHARVQPPLALVFLVSGISGLIYQVVWLRSLIRVFSITVYAVSVLLAVFMAGLALGSFVSGRSSNPLRDYGVVEVGSA